MLGKDDKKKVEKYVERILESIYADAKKNIRNKMPNQEVINNVVNLTVNKLTPESKMILSSTYNMLMEKTLAESLYQKAENKAAFYSRDILKELNSKFTFDVPSHIDYEESSRLINKWTASGVIVAGGGIISITMKNIMPIAIAVVLTGIMLFLLRNKPVGGSAQDVSAIVQDYLNNVKVSLMSWINEIEKFYDYEIKKLEERKG